jgi:chloramphenicol 3-O-phosphotransferase
VKLIFIYGPPAAGKLTVAEALAALIGFKVFHNHLTVDLAHAFFEFGTPAFGRYIDHLRLEAFEVAAREGVNGVIFTFVYALRWDDGFVQDVKDIVERRGGQVFFVQLVCDRETLEGRVAEESRQRFRKIKDVEKLREVLGRHELFASIPFVSSLTIDTTHTSPDEAARRIIEHYGFMCE